MEVMKISKINLITILVVTIVISIFLGRITKSKLKEIIKTSDTYKLDSLRLANDSIILAYQDTILQNYTVIDSLEILILTNNNKRDEEIKHLTSYSARQLDSVAFSNTNRDRYNMLRDSRFENTSPE